MFGGAVSLLLAAGCKSNDDAPPLRYEATVKAETIKFGAVLSLSGAFQDVGQAELKGAQVAVQQLNAIGGILGKPIELVILDDASVPAETTKQFEGLLAQNVRFVLGPSSSAGALAIAARVARGDALVLSPSASSDAVTAAFMPATSASPTPSTSDVGSTLGNVILRTSPTDRKLAYTLASLIALGPTKGSARRICDTTTIVYSEDDYGTLISTDVATLLGQLESTLQIKSRVPIKPFLESASQYTAYAENVINSVRERKCQIVIAPPQPAAAYLRAFRLQAQQYGLDLKDFRTFGADSLFSDSVIAASRDEVTGQSSLEGAYVLAVSGQVGPFDVFRNLYRAQFPNEEPKALQAASYDAIILTALAIERSKSVDPNLVRRTVFTNSQLTGAVFEPSRLLDGVRSVSTPTPLKFDGASGPLIFAPNGTIDANISAFQVQGGKFKVVRTFEPSEQQLQ
jgi:ABC-type branched-subunit amino acid transport system substrate-binding protein